MLQNSNFAAFLHVEPSELLQMELEFASLLNFEFYVENATFQAYSEKLEKLSKVCHKQAAEVQKQKNVAAAEKEDIESQFSTEGNLSSRSASGEENSELDHHL